MCENAHTGEPLIVLFYITIISRTKMVRALVHNPPPLYNITPTQICVPATPGSASSVGSDDQQSNLEYKYTKTRKIDTHSNTQKKKQAPVNPFPQLLRLSILYQPGNALSNNNKFYFNSFSLCFNFFQKSSLKKQRREPTSSLPLKFRCTTQ